MVNEENCPIGAIAVDDVVSQYAGEAVAVRKEKMPARILNTWITLSSSLSNWMEQGKKLNSRTRPFRRRIAVFLAVIGPGLITSNVDNDAGGITTYTVAGAQFGYTLLWSLIPMTIALYVSEEMCARMGVVTGKGLSDLIREEFGFRSTFFVMAAALAVDLGNTVAEFSRRCCGHADFWRQQVFVGAAGGVIAVDAGGAVWNARQVEKIFLVACGFYITYIVSAVLAKPDWIRSSVRRRLCQDAAHGEFQLPSDAYGPGRYNHRTLAIFLFAGGIRREESVGAAVAQARQAGCAGSAASRT